MNLPTAQIVQPSIEAAEGKRVLESGFEYSNRNNLAGAGEISSDDTLHLLIRSRGCLSRRSDLLSVTGLNANLGKAIDGDWIPLGRYARKPSGPKHTKDSYSSQDNESIQRKEPRHICPSKFVPKIDPVKREPLTNAIDLTENGFDNVPRNVSPTTFNEKFRQSQLISQGLVEVPKKVVKYELDKKELEEKIRKLAAQRYIILAKEVGENRMRDVKEEKWDTGENLQQRASKR